MHTCCTEVGRRLNSLKKSIYYQTSEEMSSRTVREGLNTHLRCDIIGGLQTVRLLWRDRQCRYLTVGFDSPGLDA